MAAKPLIKESLFLLDILGVKPTNQNLLNSIKVIIPCITYVHLLIDLAMRLIFKWEDLESMDGITELSMSYQVLIRVSVLLSYRKVFVELLRKLDYFWSLDKYNLESELNGILEKAKSAAKLFSLTLCSCGALFLLKPVFTVNKTLPFLTYHPKDLSKSPEYELVYTLQVLQMLFGCTLLLSFDGLFVSFVIYIVCELKNLKQAFITLQLKRFEERKNLNAVKVLIEHHNLILGCIKNLNAIYSLMLLNQFLCSLVCICTGALSLISSGFPPDLQLALKNILLVGAILGQLFFYCLAGTYLITETASVCDAVYESDWWIKTQPEIRRAYSLVIQRANKIEKLTAGGMFVLNLESFTKVVRTSLSFFTLVEAFYSKSDKIKFT